MTTTLLAALALAALSTGVRPPGETCAVDPVQRTSSASPVRPAQGRLLVASRTLVDPSFARTVIVLLAYDQSGALGLVLNRPTETRLAAALPRIEELRGRTDVVFFGGPVGLNRMLALVRSSRPVTSGQRVFGDVYVSGNIDVLRHALASAKRRGGVRAYAGSAGWGPGQLDREIARGDWHVVEPDARFVFDVDPAETWDRLIQRVSGEWTRREPDAGRQGSSQHSAECGRPADLARNHAHRTPPRVSAPRR